MCVVSNILDYGRQTWPTTTPWVYATVDPTPKVITIEKERVPSQAEWAAFLELLEKAKKFDEITGQPDCEDPKKQEWFDAIQEKVTELVDATTEAILDAADEFAKGLDDIRDQYEMGN